MIGYRIFIVLLSFTLVYGQNLKELIETLPKPPLESFELKKMKYFDFDYDAIIKQPSSFMDSQTFLNSFDERHQKTLEDVGYLQVVSFSVLIALWFLPEKETQWDRKKIKSKNIANSWYENVEGGPVKDEDKWWINYVGHSVAGAYYYTLARNNGLTVWESSFFNFMMSTFYWEYGVEALFEKPSIQDLWITPILGSLLGEGFYQLHLLIVENGGKVFGSTLLGSFFMTLFNPEGALADFLRVKRERIKMSLVSRYFIYEETDWADKVVPVLTPSWNESYLGVTLMIKF